MKITTALAALAVAAGLFATNPASAADRSASAYITTALTITKAWDLRFGYIVASGTPGTVTINPSSSRSYSGGATPVGGSIGAHGAASFDVNGSPLLAYTINIQGSTTIDHGGDHMTVNTFKSTPTVAAGGTLDDTGYQSIVVGAMLHVLANQNPGTYTGTFTITVAYN
jgi:hypothetical protein